MARDKRNIIPVTIHKDGLITCDGCSRLERELAEAHKRLELAEDNQRGQSKQIRGLKRDVASLKAKTDRMRPVYESAIKVVDEVQKADRDGWTASAARRVDVVLAILVGAVREGE